MCLRTAANAKGASELYRGLTDRIDKLGMNPFFSVKTIRLKKKHMQPAGVYITFNRQSH